VAGPLPYDLEHRLIIRRAIVVNLSAEMREESELTIAGLMLRKVFKKSDRFAPELVYFSDCVLKNKQPEPSGREGLADVRIIRALLESAETNRPVSVDSVDIVRRPDTKQQISKVPTTAPPQSVKAAARGAE